MVHIGLSAVGEDAGGKHPTEKRRGGCGGCEAIFAIVLGLIIIGGGLYLAYYGKTGLMDRARVFGSVQMVEPEAARAMEGELVKTHGQPTGDFLSVEWWDGQVLYCQRLVQMYNEVYDRHSSDEGPSRMWSTVTREVEWVPSFNIDGIVVIPAEAHPVGAREVHSAYRKPSRGGSYVEVDAEPGRPDLHDVRETVEVLDASSSVVVFGEMSGGQIEGGALFVVSTRDEAETLQALETEGSVEKWAARVGAVLAVFGGLMLVFWPLPLLFGHVPFFGARVTWAFAAIALLIAVICVAVVTLLPGATWFVTAVVVLGVATAIHRGVRSRRLPPPEDASGPQPPVEPMPPGN